MPIDRKAAYNSLKERLDEKMSLEDLNDILAARKDFKTGKSVPWRSVKRKISR